MKDRIFFLRTEQEHGRSPDRLRRAAALALSVPAGDSRLQPARTRQGMLYFPQAPGLHASVSHSGGIWLCALSERPVGVDLQRHQDCPAERIAERFFRPEECEALRGRSREAFFDLWCAKESYLKYCGEGLAMGLDAVSLLEGGRLRAEISGVPLRLLPFLPGFSLCLCGGLPGAPAPEPLPPDRD